MTSLKSAFADAEIYKFDAFGQWVVKDVLRLDVSVTNIPLVNVDNGVEELCDDGTESLFVFEPKLQEILVGKIFHNKIGEVLFEVEIESVIADYALMLQRLDV